eukprot:Nk52_evm8s356 gene=Nk52_evmTU8s356
MNGMNNNRIKFSWGGLVLLLLLNGVVGKVSGVQTSPATINLGTESKTGEYFSIGSQNSISKVKLVYFPDLCANSISAAVEGTVVFTKVTSTCDLTSAPAKAVALKASGVIFYWTTEVITTLSANSYSIPIVRVDWTAYSSFVNAANNGVLISISASESEESESEDDYEMSRIFLDIAIFFVMACTLSSIVATIYFWRRRNMLLHQGLATNQENSEKVVNYLKTLTPIIYSKRSRKREGGDVESVNSERAGEIDGNDEASDNSALSDDAEDQCAVCLEEFSEGQELRSIPGCGHTFHLTCVDPWLINKQTCPLCKHSILQDIPGEKKREENSSNAINRSINELMNVGIQNGTAPGSTAASTSSNHREPPMELSEFNTGYQNGTTNEENATCSGPKADGEDSLPFQTGCDDTTTPAPACAAAACHRPTMDQTPDQGEVHHVENVDSITSTQNEMSSNEIQ